MSKKIILLGVLLLVPIVFSLSDSNVNFEVQKGKIIINVNSEESYSNIIEFIVDGESRIATFDNCPDGICTESRAKIVSFDSVNIYKPGDYSFTVTPTEGDERITKNFNLELSNLYSCLEDGGFIRNNQCFFDATENLEDKGLKCVNGKSINRCTDCGCPDSNYLCCTNENTDECIGRLGECVLPGEERILEREIKEGGEVVGSEIASGCLVQEINIPQGICLNNVLDLNLNPSDSLFAQQCICADRSAEAELDGDSFDSINFIRGRDCNDNDPLINPLVVESCDPDVNNNNGVDENCDGADLDCRASCDMDADGERDANKWYCLGGNDCNDNNANVFSENEEVCGDLIDNDCNDVVDDSDVCICEIGEPRIIPGITSNGLERCVDSRFWSMVESPDNSLLVTVHTPSGLVERGDINLFANRNFDIEVKFLCPDGDCDVEII